MTEGWTEPGHREPPPPGCLKPWDPLCFCEAGRVSQGATATMPWARPDLQPRGGGGRVAPHPEVREKLGGQQSRQCQAAARPTQMCSS